MALTEADLVEADLLIAFLRRRGFELTPAPGGKVSVAPASQLTDVERDAIRGRRDAVLRVLTEEDDQARRNRPTWLAWDTFTQGANNGS